MKRVAERVRAPKRVKYAFRNVPGFEPPALHG
jgi:hypothetical protein